MDFSGKITAEDLMIRILPGGFFIAVIFFSYNYGIGITLSGNLDFLYSFLFLCLAFMVGEILQTIAHMFEFLVDIFFKGYRPSEIFLYKNNPVINNEKIRKDIINKLVVTEEEKELFEEDYSGLSIICTKDNNKKKASQRLFWKMFSSVENDLKIIKSNINYLFLRVLMVEFLLLTFILFFHNNYQYALLFSIIFIILLWRARGLARGLVFKSSLLFLKNE